MYQETIIINAEELLGNYSNYSEFQNMKDDFEAYWEWPEKMGNGTISLVNLRPGIYLEIGNFRFK